MSAVFASGAKSSEERPRFDLIPVCALEREAVRMAEGAAAHGENNYRKGVDDPVFVRDRINHLIAHALSYASGDRSTDHLAAIRCNAGMLMWIDDQHCRDCGELLDESHEDYCIVAALQIPESGTQAFDAEVAHVLATAEDYAPIASTDGGFGFKLEPHAKMGPK